LKTYTQNKCDSIIERYFNRLINGFDPNGERYIHRISGQEIEPIALCWWASPKNWTERIIKETVKDGVSVTFSDNLDHPVTGVDLHEKFTKFIEVTRKRFPFEANLDLPLSVFLLACIKHKSPLPSEFWRAQIFPVKPSVDGNSNEPPTNEPLKDI